MSTTDQKVISIIRKTADKTVAIPSIILERIYTIGSLKNCEAGVSFFLRNPMRDATVQKILQVQIDNRSVPLEDVFIKSGDKSVKATQIDNEHYIPFPLAHDLEVILRIDALEKGEHKINMTFFAQPFDEVNFDALDTIAEIRVRQATIPWDKEANYEPEIIKKRLDFIQEYSGVTVEHINKYSFDPRVAQGNIENFSGVTQTPLAFAGPLKVNGEYAQGDFLIPLSTSEGTLVASYNRGIKIINLCGGITTTVQDDCMQRAPVFIFDSARDARDFALWLDDNEPEIRQQAESTSKVAKLLEIEKYLVSRYVYLRFNYFTGDAAGQNMVSMATFVACSWILAEYKKIQHFFMESNFATDKKASTINILRTRGKRVTAEMTLKREVLIQNLRVDPETLCLQSRVAGLGAYLTGANNNGAHSANAIAALFVATGQDIANVAESSVGILLTEVTPEGDLYGSLTLPSLIVATHGGGTGLPTQRECLEIMGCYGRNKVLKFTEIVAAVAAAGEISLAGAISSLDWVLSHERYGKNR
jgi:hydroxymethylglutaryl-CoA reductase (NADPH)